MTLTARLLTLLAVIFLVAACSHVMPPSATAAPPLLPSLNRVVGRVLAVDAARGFAMVGLASEPPARALTGGTELVARTDDLRETARLLTSRQVRGRTLGTRIISGQPSPGDEVVFRPP